MENTPRNNDNQRTQKTGGYRQQPGRDRVVNRTVEILPHPEVLESYNYVVGGSAEKILEMFELEQKHRHSWEILSLRLHSFSTILGQVLGFLIAGSAFASATMIGIYGSATIAAFIWVFTMAVIVVAGLIWAYARTKGQSTLIEKPRMNAQENS